jgi:hypothetical protein
MTQLDRLIERLVMLVPGSVRPVVGIAWIVLGVVVIALSNPAERRAGPPGIVTKRTFSGIAQIVFVPFWLVVSTVWIWHRRGSSVFVTIVGIVAVGALLRFIDARWRRRAAKGPDGDGSRGAAGQ